MWKLKPTTICHCIFKTKTTYLIKKVRKPNPRINNISIALQDQETSDLMLKRHNESGIYYEMKAQLAFHE